MLASPLSANWLIKWSIRRGEGVDRPCRTQSMHLAHEALISGERRPTWLKLNKAPRLLSDVQNITRLTPRPTRIGVAPFPFRLVCSRPHKVLGTAPEGPALDLGQNVPVERSISSLEDSRQKCSCYWMRKSSVAKPTIDSVGLLVPDWNHLICHRRRTECFSLVPVWNIQEKRWKVQSWKSFEPVQGRHCEPQRFMGMCVKKLWFLFRHSLSNVIWLVSVWLYTITWTVLFRMVLTLESSH